MKQLADNVNGLNYEIIVADDGSHDQVSIINNYLINELEHCRYIRRKENVGRARIRNFLTSEANGEWLLFLDSDVCIDDDDFLQHYISAMKGHDGVIDGGVKVIGSPEMLRCNLRFWYEYCAQDDHTAEKRSLTPYQHIHTANLMMPRWVAERCPFDERITRYGYEDVLFGKAIEKAGVPVRHIDAPVGLDKFESNEKYLAKVETALGTLHEFADELRGYSSLLDLTDRLQRFHLLWAAHIFHKLFSGTLKRNLLGNKPSLLLFNIYRVTAPFS